MHEINSLSIFASVKIFVKVIHIHLVIKICYIIDRELAAQTNISPCSRRNFRISLNSIHILHQWNNKYYNIHIIELKAFATLVFTTLSIRYIFSICSRFLMGFRKKKNHRGNLLYVLFCLHNDIQQNLTIDQAILHINMVPK